MSDLDREEFADIEATLRELSSDDVDRFDPPPELWERIEAGIGASTPGAPADAPNAGTARTGAAPDDPADAPNARTADAGPAHVVSLEHRRRNRRFVALALGAAAALVIAVAGALVVSNNGSDDDPAVIARAQLSFDESFDRLGASAVADAELIELDDGHHQLRIVEADLPDELGEPADLEVWLIEPDEQGNVADLVSLGLVGTDDPGTFEVPDEVDPSTFFVVDISVEPRDGDATHSGRSILRAPLEQL